MLETWHDPVLLPLRIRTHISCEETLYGDVCSGNSMLFVLNMIFSLAQITGRGGPRVLCCGVKAKGVDTQSKKGNTVNDIS
jgi:hypothetical protein